jgi:hypothetical protein
MAPHKPSAAGTFLSNNIRPKKEEASASKEKKRRTKLTGSFTGSWLFLQ